MKVKMTRNEFMTTHRGPYGHLPTEMSIDESWLTPSLASALREGGISNCTQFKSAFSSGNGEQSPRAKGNYEAKYLGLVEDAKLMRAFAETFAGTKKYARYDSAAKWLEELTVDFIDGIARLRSIELID